MKNAKAFARACASVLLAASLAASVGVTCRAAEKKGVLVVLGDSIATGHSLPDYNSGGNPKSKHSWSTLLAEKYGAKQVNLAVDGDTTSDLLLVVRNVTNRRKIEKADVICVSIGGNNFLQMMTVLVASGSMFSSDEVEKSYVQMETAAKSDLDAIFAELKEINPDATVMVQTLFEPYRYFTVPITVDKTVAEWMGAYVERYNAVLTARANEYGITVIDVAAKFENDGDKTWLYSSMESGTLIQAIAALVSSNPHPTLNGHRGIFDAYVEAADAVLAKAFAADEERLQGENPTVEKSKAGLWIGIGAAVVVVASAAAFVCVKKKK